MKNICNIKRTLHKSILQHYYKSLNIDYREKLITLTISAGKVTKGTHSIIFLLSFSNNAKNKTKILGY